MRNIVVISAHPDDEILGVGGTLLKHKKMEIKYIGLLPPIYLKTKVFPRNALVADKKKLKKFLKH